MKIAVTGATGFTGSHTLPELLKRGHRLRCLVRRAETAVAIAAMGCEVVVGDLADEMALGNAFRGCDALVSIASLGFGHAEAVVRLAEESGIRRAVFVSTTGIFTRLNPRSKALRLAAEERIRRSRLHWTILRPTMIYGTVRDRNICRLIRFLRYSPVLPVLGPGRALMQPVHVDDVAKAIADSLECPVADGRSYNLAGEAALTYNDMVKTVATLMRRRVWLVHLPYRPAVLLLGWGERWGVTLPLKAEQILRLQEDKVFSWEDAARDFGFAPRAFQAGIAAEVDEVRRGF